MRRFLTICTAALMLPLAVSAQLASLRVVVLGNGGEPLAGAGGSANLTVGQTAAGSITGSGSGLLGFWGAAKFAQAGDPPGTALLDLAEAAGFQNEKYPVGARLNITGGLVAATFKGTVDYSKIRLAERDVRTTELTESFIVDADVRNNPGRFAVSIASDTPLPPGGGNIVDLPFHIRRQTTTVGEIIPVLLTEATLVYDDGTVLTNVIPDLGDGSIEVVEPGDVNGDAVIDLQDVVYILRVVAGTAGALTPFELATADADRNGIVTVDDALFLMRGLTRAKVVPGGVLEPITLSLPMQTDEFGGVTVPVQFSRDASVNAFDLLLVYDPDLATLEDIEVVAGAGLVIENTQTPGIIRLVGLDMHGFTTVDRRFAEVHFRRRTDEDPVILLEEARFLDMSGEAYPVYRPGEEPALPEGFELIQNYPNPFNPETVITYDLPEAAQVSISIYNALGQQVEELLHDRQRAGRHQIVWQAANHAPGVFFFVLEAGSYRQSMKMMLVK
jgi:hypothetical protein